MKTYIWKTRRDSLRYFQGEELKGSPPLELDKGNFYVKILTCSSVGLWCPFLKFVLEEFLFENTLTKIIQMGLEDLSTVVPYIFPGGGMYPQFSSEEDVPLTPLLQTR